MKLVAVIGSVAFVTFGLALAFIPGLQEAVATTTTITITGWNVPSGTTFGNGLVALILPLVTMGAFAGLPLVLEQRGGIIVTMAFIGYIIGAAAGMLSFPTTSGPTLIPFANIIIAVVLLIVWLWKSGE